MLYLENCCKIAMVQNSLFIAKRLALGKFKTFASLIIKLAWFGVGLSVAVMIISIAVVVGYKKEITEKVLGFGGHIEIHSTGSIGNFDYQQFNDSIQLKKDLLNIKGVVSINSIISRPGILKAENDIEGIVFKGVSEKYNFSFLNKNKIRGRIVSTKSPLEKREIIVSNILAKKLKIDTGDMVKIYFINQPMRVIPCKIASIYETGLEESDKLFIIGNLSEMQRIFAKKEQQITHYEVQTNNYKNIESINQIINESLPIDLRAESLVKMNPQIFDWLGYLDQNIVIILTLMIIVACINMTTALLILIIERTNMIGILKAMGMKDSSIKNIFLNHALYILMIGLLIGNAIGFSLSFIQSKFKILTLSQETYYLSYVPIDLSLTNILFINIGTIAICMIALLIPVRMITKISPVEAIKFN